MYIVHYTVRTFTNRISKENVCYSLLYTLYSV